MKNEEKLLYTIGNVNEEFVPSDKKKKSPLKWAVIGTSAAAAAIAGFVVMRGAAFSNLPNTMSPFDGEGVDIVETEDSSIIDDILTADNISDSSDIAPNGLPKIPYNSFSIQGVGFTVESMGHIGYNAAEDLITDCPWNEEQGITSMPVYKNLSYGGDYVYPDCYLNEEKMSAIAEEMAEALGLTIRDHVFFNSIYNDKNITELLNEEEEEEEEENDEYMQGVEYEEEEASAYYQDENCFMAICDGESYGVEAVKILVWGRGSVGISISDLEPNSNPNYMQLPEEYINNDEELSDYLKECFKDLMNFDNPSDADLFSCYNVTDDPVQNIVNYSFESVRFNVHPDYRLMGMAVDKRLSVSEEVGEYEIITAEEAQSKLLNAYEDFEPRLNYKGEKVKQELTEADIEAVTLFYPYLEHGCEDIEYFKPYYCFFVKSEHWSPDWDAYQVFFVPALKDEYILY